MANRGRPKGYQVSKETRKKISEGNKGKKQSESSKQRISQSKKGTSTWNKGKAMSEETKRKMYYLKQKIENVPLRVVKTNIRLMDSVKVIGVNIDVQMTLNTGIK